MSKIHPIKLGIAHRKIANFVPNLFLIMPDGRSEKVEPNDNIATDHAASVVVKLNFPFSCKIGIAGELQPNDKPKSKPPPHA